MRSMQDETFLSHSKKKTKIFPRTSGVSFNTEPEYSINKVCWSIVGGFVELCEALIQEKETGRQSDEAVTFLQLSVYSPLGTSLLEGQRIYSMLCKQSVLRQRVPLYLHDCTWCCLFLSHSYGRAMAEPTSLVFFLTQGHYSSKPISLA